MHAFVLFLLLSLTGISQAYLASDKQIWYGTITFPHVMQAVPPVRVYYAGNKLNVEIDQGTKEITFCLAEHKQRTEFNLLIASDIDWVTAAANTIDYLKVPEATQYKLYHLTFKASENCWQIEAIQLPEDRRIPDNTIIVRYHPLFIKEIQGGSAYELPKIILDERTLDNLSPEELHDASVHLFLGSLNCDTMHAKTTQVVKSHHTNKTVSLILT